MDYIYTILTVRQFYDEIIVMDLSAVDHKKGRFRKFPRTHMKNSLENGAAIDFTNFQRTRKYSIYTYATKNHNWNDKLSITIVMTCDQKRNESRQWNRVRPSDCNHMVRVSDTLSIVFHARFVDRFWSVESKRKQSLNQLCSQNCFWPLEFWLVFWNDQRLIPS